MKRPRKLVHSTDNNRWYERYGRHGYFCLPRALLLNMLNDVDNATLHVYFALTSCHFEGSTTFAAAPYLSKLTGKDEGNIRDHLADLERLGLIRRETFGRGYRILFQCPDRERIKEGAAQVKAHRDAKKARRDVAKALRAESPVK